MSCFDNDFNERHADRVDASRKFAEGTASSCISAGVTNRGTTYILWVAERQSRRLGALFFALTKRLRNPNAGVEHVRNIFADYDRKRLESLQKVGKIHAAGVAFTLSLPTGAWRLHVCLCVDGGCFVPKPKQFKCPPVVRATVIIINYGI